MIDPTDSIHMMTNPGGPSHVNFDALLSDFDARYGVSAYGSIYSNGTIARVMTLINTWYEMDGATAWDTGLLYLCTFTDPYIVATLAGTYLVNWNISGQVSANNQGVGAGIMVDQTTVQNQGQARTYYLNSTRNLDMGGTAIIALTANQKVSLAVRNITSAGKTFTLQKGNLTILRIGA